MFQNIDAFAGDPILSLVDEFNKDSREDKINLSIGIYYDGKGGTPQLRSVSKAKIKINKLPAIASLYLPMEGLPNYRLAIQKLLLGPNNPLINEQRIATVQTIGGSGALKLGADFLHRYFPYSDVWCSDPTWGNHASIFIGSGINVHYYPYFDVNSKEIKFSKMLEMFRRLPEKSIILMHPCCHNPTGSDLTYQQWDQVTVVAKERNLIPFLDIAYQGFAKSMKDDAYAIRTMASAGLPILISNSFSKNFCLYGDRVGGLSIICQNKQQSELVLGQLKAGIRRIYSSPPANGAKIVEHVLTNDKLRIEWLSEVESMRQRIFMMRRMLVKNLKNMLPKNNFDYLLEQNGIFGYVGFNLEQVIRLRKEYAIYLISTGRICIAGINEYNVKRIAKAFVEVME